MKLLGSLMKKAAPNVPCRSYGAPKIWAPDLKLLKTHSTSIRKHLQNRANTSDPLKDMRGPHRTSLKCRSTLLQDIYPKLEL